MDDSKFIEWHRMFSSVVYDPRTQEDLENRLRRKNFAKILDSISSKGKMTRPKDFTSMSFLLFRAYIKKKI